MINNLKCPKCDEYIENGWNYCPNCGECVVEDPRSYIEAKIKERVDARVELLMRVSQLNETQLSALMIIMRESEQFRDLDGPWVGKEFELSKSQLAWVKGNADKAIASIEEEIHRIECELKEDVVAFKKSAMDCDVYSIADSVPRAVRNIKEKLRRRDERRETLSFFLEIREILVTMGGAENRRI